jgi:hypothetical protein
VREIVERVLEADEDEAAEQTEPATRDPSAPTVACVGCGRRGLVHAVHVACSRATVDAVALTADSGPPPTSAVDHVDARAVASRPATRTEGAESDPPGTSRPGTGEHAGAGSDGASSGVDGAEGASSGVDGAEGAPSGVDGAEGAPSGVDGAEDAPSGVDGIREALRTRTDTTDLLVVTGDLTDPVSAGLAGIVADAVGGDRGPYVVTILEAGTDGATDAATGLPSTVVEASDVTIPVDPGARSPADPAGLAGDLARDLVECVRPETAAELVLVDLLSLGSGVVGRLSVSPLGGGRTVEDVLGTADAGERPPDDRRSGRAGDDAGSRRDGVATVDPDRAEAVVGHRGGEEVPTPEPDWAGGHLALVCAGPDAPRERIEAIAAAAVRNGPASGRVLWDARLDRRHARRPHLKMVRVGPGRTTGPD